MKISDARLERLIEEATVDAYNDSEQRVGFLTMQVSILSHTPAFTQRRVVPENA